MKPEAKKKRVKKPVIAIYMNTSDEFKKKFMKDVKRFGMSASGFANMCLIVGYNQMMTNLDPKKFPSTKKKMAA